MSLQLDNAIYILLCHDSKIANIWVGVFSCSLETHSLFHDPLENVSFKLYYNKSLRPIYIQITCGAFDCAIIFSRKVQRVSNIKTKALNIPFTHQRAPYKGHIYNQLAISTRGEQAEIRGSLNA